MDYKEAIEISKIPRINWKKVLGMSMAKFIMLNKHLNKDQLVLAIYKQYMDCPSEHIMDIDSVHKNIEIGVSARLAEIKIYQMKGGLDK